jgi:hypothetical protein
MKDNVRYKLFALLFLGVILIGGCTSNKPANISTTFTITTNRTKAPNTLPVYTATHTPTPTMTPTITSVPTLASEVAYARVNEFLANGSSCQLPCWMGIVPGKSTLLDLHESLTRFSGIATDEYEELPAIPDNNMLSGGLTLSFPKDDYGIEFHTNYISFAGEDKISIIGFASWAYKLNSDGVKNLAYEYPPYNEFFSAYTLSGILSSYGTPDLIYINAGLGRDSLPQTPLASDYFLIHILYPEQGIAMRYEMSVEGVGDNYRFCPSNSFIQGYLIPPSTRETFLQVLQNSGDDFSKFSPPSEFTKTPEEAFGMTIGEFYQIFRKPTDRCLDTQKKIWWWWEK